MGCQTAKEAIRLLTSVSLKFSLMIFLAISYLEHYLNTHLYARFSSHFEKMNLKINFLPSLFSEIIIYWFTNFLALLLLNGELKILANQNLVTTLYPTMESILKRKFPATLVSRALISWEILKCQSERFNENCLISRENYHHKIGPRLATKLKW